MADFTPRTRSESFLNGEDLEPITRREHFYAGRENELPEGHQEPETREEWFIQKYREAGDVTVESLSITENGTYTAPSGKAYSPVSVNVPLPSNAYLLKSIENVNIATFADGTDNFIKSLEVAIEPQQDLHGYDYPWVGGAGKNKFDGTATLDNKWINSQGEVESQYGFWTSDYIPVKQGDVIRRTSTGSGRGALYDTNKENAVYSSGTEVTATQSGYYRFCGDKSVILPTGNVVCTINNTDLTFAPYSNICPISGWSETNVNVNDGQNLFGGTFNALFPLFIPKNTRITVSSKTQTSLAAFNKDKNQIDYWGLYDVDTTTGRYYRTLNFQYDIYYVKFIYTSSEELQIKYGTDVTYSTYNGHTYTIDLDGTRYGGKLDVVSGVLTLTDGFISSYNGETLPSTWISDRDVYAEGTTPTTGAEVCYKLATPQTIQLTPTIIKSLQGANNLFASTGEIELLQYWGEVN